MKTNGRKKYKKILFAGRNKEDGSIAYNWMYQRRWEAVNRLKIHDHYEVIKVQLSEI